MREKLGDDASGGGTVETHLPREICSAQLTMAKKRLQSRRDIILANPTRRTREQRNFVQDSVFPCGFRQRERRPAP
jgi:hypothetical protein